MIIKEPIKTQYGDVETNIVHCDGCGKKALIDGALRWLELRHLDRDVPPLHFCNLRCVVLGTSDLLAIGVEEMAMTNWSQIVEHVSEAEGWDHALDSQVQRNREHRRQVREARLEVLRKTCLIAGL